MSSASASIWRWWRYCRRLRSTFCAPIRERVAPSATLIAGLCAATTMNFKPYFVFAVGFCILTAAAQARDWRVLFAPENWIAAVLVAIHGICIVVFYPDYFTLIYPLVRDVYLLLKAPLLAILLTSATALWLVAIMVVLALRPPIPNFQRC
jgi:hypothetical protein